MAWSTKEIAELAGTTLRTVRHYHDIGLLAVPERDPNGYKRYGVAALVELVRIRRLVALGFSLPQIAAMAPTDEGRAESLRQLDGELADKVAELQRARAELSTLLHAPSPDPLFGGALAAAAGHPLTGSDRSYLTVLARVASPQVVEAYVAMIGTARDPAVLTELDALPPDCDEQTRERLAVRLAEHTRQVYAAYPILRDVTAGTPVGRAAAEQALAMAAADFYNPAQVDVMRRAAALTAVEAGV